LRTCPPDVPPSRPLPSDEQVLTSRCCAACTPEREANSYARPLAANHRGILRGYGRHVSAQRGGKVPTWNRPKFFSMYLPFVLECSVLGAWVLLRYSFAPWKVGAARQEPHADCHVFVFASRRFGIGSRGVECAIDPNTRHIHIAVRCGRTAHVRRDTRTQPGLEQLLERLQTINVTRNPTCVADNATLSVTAPIRSNIAAHSDRQTSQAC
jgi:hypothetical protein